MALVEPPVRSVDAPDPPSATRFEILEDGLGAELSLAGRGGVRVDSREVVISVADGAARGELERIAREWGRPLWLALNGTFPFHGTVLERDGFGLALLGESRVGCSLAAMGLATRGWRLVADGECPLRMKEDGTIAALPNNGGLEVDTAITAMGDTGWPETSLDTGRARSELAVPRASGECPVGAIVELRLARSTDQPELVPAERAEVGAARTLRQRCSIGDGILGLNANLRESLDAFCEAVVADTPCYVALVPEGRADALFPPSSVAAFIAERVEAIGGPSSSKPAPA